MESNKKYWLESYIKAIDSLDFLEDLDIIDGPEREVMQKNVFTKLCNYIRFSILGDEDD